jgi:hypothetical protein
VIPGMTGPQRGAAQALSTWIASDGMEACRRACGGHGFSQLSGLPSILQSYVQNVTWEGDNNVMLLQARPVQSSPHRSAGLLAIAHNWPAPCALSCG